MIQNLQTPGHMSLNVSSSGPSNEANMFLGLTFYGLNSLLGALDLVYISLYSIRPWKIFSNYFLKRENSFLTWIHLGYYIF